MDFSNISRRILGNFVIASGGLQAGSLGLLIFAFWFIVCLVGLLGSHERPVAFDFLKSHSQKPEDDNNPIKVV